jgi:hypothetical protein
MNHIYLFLVLLLLLASHSNAYLEAPKIVTVIASGGEPKPEDVGGYSSSGSQKFGNKHLFV